MIKNQKHKIMIQLSSLNTEEFKLLVLTLLINLFLDLKSYQIYNTFLNVFKLVQKFSISFNYFF